jgi:hypothetical protein
MVYFFKKKMVREILNLAKGTLELARDPRIKNFLCLVQQAQHRLNPGIEWP